MTVKLSDRHSLEIDGRFSTPKAHVHGLEARGSSVERRCVRSRGTLGFP